MEIKVGDRLTSSVCETEVIVVKAPVGGEVDLRCGGVPMGTGAAVANGSPSSGWAEGSQIGKRYGDEAVGIEVLVTRGGVGTLAIGEHPLTQRDAKKLPSTD